MKLREYANRFPGGNIWGAIIYIPGQMSRPMALVMYSGQPAEGIAWFSNVDQYPDGQMTLILTSSEDLLNMEVSGFARPCQPLMEGDYIWVADRRERVIRVKEGNGSPYPIITARGQYKWTEIKMISKEAI